MFAERDKAVETERGGMWGIMAAEAERDKAVVERDTLKAEMDILKAERETVVEERDALREQLAKMKGIEASTMAMGECWIVPSLSDIPPINSSTAVAKA